MLVLVVVYLVAEVVGGLLTGSLALLADAGHMLSDAGALALALFATHFAQRKPTATRTFGYYRTEILAALANAALLLAISAWIVVEAVGRLATPRDVLGGPMAAVAAGGLLVNAIGLWLLHDARHANLNLRGAWLHVLGDALGSVGAVVAGLCVWAFGWSWADPAASTAIALLVVWAAWNLLRASVAVLMEGVPPHIDVDDVRAAMLAAPGVAAVHDLHVWTIASGLEALSAHVVVGEPGSRQVLLDRLRELLHDRFGIDHTTIQIEEAECEASETCY
jgi:cobalt-zinc-cadmium efflux system protein